MAYTRAAPRCSRQSVKPPVEAPTSAQTRPPTSSSKAVNAASSFSPPRETNRGPCSSSSCASARHSRAGFQHHFSIDAHLARHDQRLGVRPRFGQAPLHHQRVQPHLVHGGIVMRPRAIRWPWDILREGADAADRARLPHRRSRGGLERNVQQSLPTTPTRVRSPPALGSGASRCSLPLALDASYAGTHSGRGRHRTASGRWHPFRPVHRIRLALLNLDASAVKPVVWDPAPWPAMPVGSLYGMARSMLSSPIPSSSTSAAPSSSAAWRRRSVGSEGGTSFKRPTGAFLIEPHFVFPLYQFLPNALQVWLLRRFNLGWIPTHAGSSRSPPDDRQHSHARSQRHGPALPGGPHPRREAARD